MRISNSGHSVLASGDWFKIGVTHDQVYRLDYTFLQKAGIPVSSIDPRTMKIYGNGGHMLPQENSTPRPDDLTENAIYVNGEENGRFDPGDYILFYGKSPHKLELQNDSIQYLFNLYSDTTFYFLTYGNGSGKRIPVSGFTGYGFPEVTSYEDLVSHEVNATNILESGREWYGEKFDFQTGYNFTYDLPGIVPGSSLTVISSVMGQAFSPASFDVSVNGVNLGNQPIEAVPDATYALKGTDQTSQFSASTSTLPGPEKLTLKWQFNKASLGASVGYLNYFIVRCKRRLIYRNASLEFRSVESLSNPVSLFRIINAHTGNRVWDITDTLDPAELKTDVRNDTLAFDAPASDLRTFILFEDALAGPPASIRKIANQDLHGMGVPGLLIITHPLFYAQAERLAGFRSSAGIDSRVVTTEQVYNEFSSGAQDVTALRDFIRYLYLKGSKTRLKYVLLFGKSSYDYKNVITRNSNFVPIYESRNSLHPVFSYASDDYYSFLEDNEGYWDETSSGDYTMDLAIGRLPVRSEEEARIIVDKLIHYDSGNDRFGDWRSRICFVADDGDGVDGTIHENDADRLAVYVDTAYTNYTLKKIYVDAYPQILEPSEETSPEAKKSILDALTDGLLIINFTGHGSESQWTSEGVFDLATIASLSNRERLPLFVTATCEFGRQDNPRIISGAEYLLFNNQGGAIGLVTTSRPVFSSTNFILNKAFYEQVFRKDDQGYRTIGEVFRITKNSSLNGPVNRNFSLLGDPSMKLAFPEYQAHISQINTLDISQPDTLKALQPVSLKGFISGSDGNPATDYNGTVTLSVYDKPVVHRTLGAQDPVMTFTERDNLIFRGDASVINGIFQSAFVVPQNINYRTGEGRINLYSIKDDLSADAMGSESRLIVGGSEKDYSPDDTPPEVHLFLYDTTYHQGDLAGANPVLIARLHDDNGISTASYGLDVGIEAWIDGQSVDLTPFYKADKDNFRSGTVEYPMSGFEDGSHHIELTARDTYNNPGTGILDFTVAHTRELVISDLMNFPNPFHGETTFSFVQNRAGEDLEIGVDIFDTRGTLVRELKFTEEGSEYKVNNLGWDGTGSTGKKLQSGLYIYRVTVRSLRDGVQNSRLQKLIINN